MKLMKTPQTQQEYAMGSFMVEENSLTPTQVNFTL